MKDFKLDSLTIEPTYAVRMIWPRCRDPALSRHLHRAPSRAGRRETVKALSSSIYVRRDGKWWSVLYQETPIK